MFQVMHVLIEVGQAVRTTFFGEDGQKLEGSQKRGVKKFGFGGCLTNGLGYLAQHTWRPMLQTFRKIWPDLCHGQLAFKILVVCTMSPHEDPRSTMERQHGFGESPNHLTKLLNRTWGMMWMESWHLCSVVFNHRLGCPARKLSHVVLSRMACLCTRAIQMRHESMGKLSTCALLVFVLAMGHSCSSRGQ